ncbi:MarR family transcriptional regulator [Geothrix rubra]|uniref:MarR family transcriptional regulator n=1 Tax=Geothrix rubra TaxID=2927977 RepID=A0ABQ5Q6S6_9BACT|nr:MarR family transcriptional regulator [Geothrix rubra]GLH70219.1 MarR family transcriptional regulator [Geothrix rubra]
MSLQEELQLSKLPSPGVQLMLQLLLTREAIVRVQERLFEAHGLTIQQYNVLRIVRGGPAKGHPIFEIERRQIYRFANVTRLVDRLEVQGLLKRVQDTKDRRVSRVVITPKGRRLMERLEGPVQELSDRITSCCTEEQCLALGERLEKLRDHCLREETLHPAVPEPVSI